MNIRLRSNENIRKFKSEMVKELRSKFNLIRDLVYYDEVPPTAAEVTRRDNIAAAFLLKVNQVIPELPPIPDEDSSEQEIDRHIKHMKLIEYHRDQRDKLQRDVSMAINHVITFIDEPAYSKIIKHADYVESSRNFDFPLFWRTISIAIDEVGYAKTINSVQLMQTYFGMKQNGQESIGDYITRYNQAYGDAVSTGIVTIMGEYQVIHFLKSLRHEYANGINIILGEAVVNVLAVIQDRVRVLQPEIQNELIQNQTEAINQAKVAESFGKITYNFKPRTKFRDGNEEKSDLMRFSPDIWEKLPESSKKQIKLQHKRAKKMRKRTQQVDDIKKKLREEANMVTDIREVEYLNQDDDLFVEDEEDDIKMSIP